MPNSATLRALTVACLAGFLASGCQSTAKKDPLSFASVEIHDRSLKEIMEITRAVFVENGYHSVAPSEDLVFEKQGSRMNQLAWGGWLGDDSGLRL